MKSLLSFLLIALFLSPTHRAESTDWEALVKTSPIIMAVDVQNDLAYQRLVIVEHWKGDYVDNSSVRATEDSFELQSDKSYLLFAALEKGTREIKLIVEPIILNEVPAELRTVLYALPCYVEEESAAYKKRKDPCVTGACHRIYEPVCGCNGTTYGNSCEALVKGIVKYTMGECNNNKKPDR